MAATKTAAAKKTATRNTTAVKGGTVTVIQTGSPIGRTQDQRATLIGLGLNKMHRKNTLQDSPSVRGMINKIQHLVTVVEE